MFEDQIACADLVMLNKSDLLDAAGAARANAVVAGALPRAVKIVPVDRRQGRSRRRCSGSASAVEDDIENRRTHHDDELDHEHDEFDSFVVELPAIADPADAGGAACRRRPSRTTCCASRASPTSAASRCGCWCRRSGRASTITTTGPGARRERARGRLVVIGLKGIDRAAIARDLLGG